MDLGLKGKCALVTGASKGFRTSYCREESAKEGARLFALRQGQGNLSKTATRRFWRKVVAISANVTMATLRVDAPDHRAAGPD